METTRTTGSCCGHAEQAAPAHRTATPAAQGYTPVDQLHNEIDKLFGSFFGGAFSPWGAFTGLTPHMNAEAESDMLIPRMDLSVSDKAYRATVELPGVAQDQVNIEVRDNMLIVEGEKKNEAEEKDEKSGYCRVERSYGSFRRAISLPEDAEIDKISATHKDGVLNIEIPRQEPEKPTARKIEVMKG